MPTLRVSMRAGGCGAGAKKNQLHSFMISELINLVQTMTVAVQAQEGELGK